LSVSPPHSPLFGRREAAMELHTRVEERPEQGPWAGLLQKPFDTPPMKA